MNENKNVPELRFPGFEGEWVISNLDKVSAEKFSNGVFNDPRKVGSGFRLINVKDMFEGDYVNVNNLTLIELEQKEFEKNRVCYGDVFFTRSSLVADGIAVSNICLSHDADITFDGHLVRMRPNLNKLNPMFLGLALKTSYLRKQLIVRGKTTTMTTIGQEDIKTVNLPYPSMEEQQKIADFLSAVDKKIEQLTEKHRLLTEYKKGVMQQIFSQQIRFKDDGGNEYPEWEEKMLGEITVRKTAKNKDEIIKQVFTNSAIQGIVSQTDYFDKDIANQNNLGGYYIVDTEDFVYNPRISNAAPVGPIKRNHLGQGVMSPLYTVFSFTEGNMDFFERYFETVYWHSYMNGIANFGARHDRMNITGADFQSMPLPWPCLEEQQKIADFLTAIDNKIDQARLKLEQTKAFKKGLLQKVLV